MSTRSCCRCVWLGLLSAVAVAAQAQSSLSGSIERHNERSSVDRGEAWIDEGDGAPVYILPERRVIREWDARDRWQRPPPASGRRPPAGLGLGVGSNIGSDISSGMNIGSGIGSDTRTSTGGSTSVGIGAGIGSDTRAIVQPARPVHPDRPRPRPREVRQDDWPRGP